MLEKMFEIPEKILHKIGIFVHTSCYTNDTFYACEICEKVAKFGMTFNEN